MPRSSHYAILSLRPDLCLEFVNTLAWRGSLRSESLHQFSDLLEWCGSSGALPRNALEEVRKWSAKNPADAAAVLQAAIDIRELIYRLFIDLTSEKPLDGADLRALNSALAQAPARTSVAANAHAFGWSIAIEPPSAATLLATVLWSAADLIISANRKRIRHCANDKCLWMFIDDSKNRSRRWCSMQACGNRAKAQRHYQRQKST
jgi:predicted RNA-binding Zn ribbon-like protein